ncbi:MAG: cytochrome c biogenesis protein CcdA, partial [Alphaproteobacteria bacterium]
MTDVSLWGAAIAGLLSFLSPCILPIVPFYLGYMAGAAIQAAGDGPVSPALRRRAVISAAFFSAGVITVFVAMGASATAIGHLLREWFDVLRIAAALIIGAMALHFL